MVHFIPLENRKHSLAKILSGRILLAAGLDWTKAEPGLSLQEQAQKSRQNSYQGSYQASYQNSWQTSWQNRRQRRQNIHQDIRQTSFLNGSLTSGIPGFQAPASDTADLAPDHGLVIEERAGFARLYGLHGGTKAAAANTANGMQAKTPKDANCDADNAVCDAACDGFCTVYSLAALRLQSLRHGIEIWPLPKGSLSGDFHDSQNNRDSQDKQDSLDSSDSQGNTENTDRPAAYWVFAARLGRLSARADKCFSSLDEALALARRLQDSLDLQEPRVLGEKEVLQELNKLGQAGSEVMHKAKLKPLSLMSCQLLHNRGLRRGLAAFLFGGLVISACCFLSDPIAQRLSPGSQTLAQKQEQDARAEAVAAVMRHPERFFPSDWMTAPSPAASVLATVPQMLKTPLAANGWTLEEVRSDKGTLTALWKAGRASSLLLPPEGAERMADDATKARSVTETPMPEIQPGSHARQWQDLSQRDEVQAVLSELAARFGLKMQLSWKPVRTIKKDNAVISCPWVAGSLVLSQAPGTLFFDFGSLTECLKEQRLARCLVLSGIAWNKTQWIMQGEVYAKP